MRWKTWSLFCMLQAVAVPVIRNVCQMFMHGLNHLQIYGAEKLHKASSQRSEDKPPLTKCQSIAGFSAEGIYQKGMDLALSKLNNGGWVHIFADGSHSWDCGKIMSSSKRGIVRWVMDADNTPIVVTFVLGCKKSCPKELKSRVFVRRLILFLSFVLSTRMYSFQTHASITLATN